MKVRHRLWLIGAVVALSLSLVASPVAAITDGSHDGNAHPNVGILYIDGIPGSVAFCSGSLLSAHEFLTAGHCTDGLTALGVTADLVHVSFDEQVSIDDDWMISADHPIGVTGWVTHPDYWNVSAGTLRNDVGLVHLAANVNLTPIDLPEIGFLDTEAAQGGLHGHDFVNVGYGWNSVDRSWQSPKVAVTWEHRRMVSETRFLALTPDLLAQLGGNCGGDSGGPHFYGDQFPNMAVAVTSTGPTACTADLAQRLDTEAVHDWLQLYR